MCIHRWICTPKSANPGIELGLPGDERDDSNQRGDAGHNRGRLPHEYCLNTPHAATAEPITATYASTFVSVHAVPLGAGALPAMAAASHKQVVPDRNRPSATMFLEVHIAPPLDY
jgi:hypothetical protein